MKEIENQEKLWDKIAEDWHEFKQIPAESITKFLQTAKGNVLDLGSGSGRHLTKIKNGKMYLVDFSNEMLKLAEEKAKKAKIDAEFTKAKLNKLPFSNNFFDYAICISALHCVETEKERKESINELYRVLKQGGQAYIGVWNVESKRFKKKKKKGKEQLIGWTDKGKRYYYLYDEKEIHEQVKEAGFEIVSTHNSEMMINFIVKKN